MRQSTSNHYNLTKKQQHILHLLYCFRFATSEHLSATLDVSKATINKRLKLMVDLQYVGRRYDSEYRLLHKHAAYFLLPRGINLLKQTHNDRYTAGVLKNIKHDSVASDQFVGHCLALFEVCCALRATYGAVIRFFSKTQLVKYDYFENFVPSAYFRIEMNGQEKDFFLEFLESSTPLFAHMKMIKQYTQYFDEGTWEAKTESSFPSVVLICDKRDLRERLLRKGLGTIDETGDLAFYATTTSGLKDELDNLLPDQS